MLKILLSILLLQCSLALAVKVKVGAIFFADEIDLKQAFTKYITSVNQHPYNDDLELMPIIRYATTDEGSDIHKLACELIDDGVIAIFGPSSKTSSEIIASLCNSIEIPHLLFDWRAEESVLEKQERMMTVNVYPDTIVLSKMYAKIVQYLMVRKVWSAWTVVYDSQEGLTRLQDILQLKTIGHTFTKVRSIDKGMDYRTLWKDIKLSGERQIILDCSPDIVMDVIHAAAELNMTTLGNSFLLTHLDTYTAAIDVLKDFEATFHIVKLGADTDSYMDAPTPTRVLVLHDAVRLLAEVFRDYLKSYPQSLHPPRLSCTRSDKWRHGKAVRNKMRAFTDEDGMFLTRSVQFGQYNDREHFVLEMETRTEDNRTITEFSTLKDFEEAAHSSMKKGGSEALRDAKLIVATRVGEPYVIDKNRNGSNFEGNQRYEGYAIDLIAQLAKDLHFRYVIEVVEDDQYGSFDANTKQWNGIIGQLIGGKAHLGICDLTITPERREVVDFTVPFMSLGISILYYNEPPEPPDLFSFLQPFALEVWVYMATAYLILSLLLFFMARISKNEWENPHPCNQNPEELENKWNLSNTTWLTMGSIMGQGCDLLPRSGTMRLVSGMWWFFGLMMLNSYTANLAAFLTSSRMPDSIESIEDLAGQTKIKFGTVRSGSTRTFFKDSNDSTFRQVYTKMETATPSVYTSSNKEGLDRVKKGKGKYAFLMETTSLQYLKERNCDVKQVGGQIGQKHYGIALPLGSPYRFELSVQILRMSERGELFKLKEKWWLTKEDCPVFSQNDSNELSIEQLGGVFLVLGCGIFVAFMIGLFEFIWNVQRVAVEEKVTPLEALKSEAMFAMKFWITKKPIRTTSEESSATESGSHATEKSENSHND